MINLRFSLGLIMSSLGLIIKSQLDPTKVHILDIVSIKIDK